MKHETSHTFARLMSLLVEQGRSRDEARLAAAWLMDRNSEFVLAWFAAGQDDGAYGGHQARHLVKHRSGHTERQD
jgi:hypothetical protein